MSDHYELIRAVQKSSRTLAKSDDFDSLIKGVLRICVEAVDAYGGTIYLHDPTDARLRFQHVLPESVREKLGVIDIPDDFGFAGDAFHSHKCVRRTFPKRPQSEWNEIEMAIGVPLESTIAVPLMMEDEMPIGIIQLVNKNQGEFEESDENVLDTIAAVATMAYHNFRLREESNRASTLLGMGKVSHDIGNLASALSANVTVGEMILESREEIKPNIVTEQLEEIFVDLKKSVDRIVGYSRLISDMSAGRMPRPTCTVGDPFATIELATSYLEPDASKAGVKLELIRPTIAVEIAYDELFMIRIVQNLVGNAIKAVHEYADSNRSKLAGEAASVQIRLESDKDNLYLKVQDNGPGMSEHVARRILAGTAKSQWDKAEGSGWGMKIVLELTSALNGSLSIESEAGKGSTFIVQFPKVLAELSNN